MNMYTSGEAAVSRFVDTVTSTIDRPTSGDHAVRIRSVDARGRKVSVYLTGEDVEAIVRANARGEVNTTGVRASTNKVTITVPLQSENSLPVASGERHFDQQVRAALTRIGIGVPEVPAPGPLQPLNDEIAKSEAAMANLGAGLRYLVERRDRLQQSATASEFPEWSE